MPHGAPAFIYYPEKLPEVNSVRVMGKKVFVRFSEGVKRESFEKAFSLKHGANIISGIFSFNDEDRIAKFTPTNPLFQNETLTLTITTHIKDLSGNKIKNEFSQSFAFTRTDLIVYDRIAPDVESAKLISDRFFVEFSEEIDPATISNSSIGLLYPTATKTKY